MASPTRRLKVRRKLSKTGSGKARKNKNRNNGSTAANLPLNMPNANEKAHQKQS